MIQIPLFRRNITGSCSSLNLRNPSERKRSPSVESKRKCGPNRLAYSQSWRNAYECNAWFNWSLTPIDLTSIWFYRRIWRSSSAVCRPCIATVDPGIHNRSGYEAFEVGLQEDVFVKQQSGDIFIGQVWPGYTAFPSWFGANTQQWWKNHITGWRIDDCSMLLISISTSPSSNNPYIVVDALRANCYMKFSLRWNLTTVLMSIILQTLATN